MPGGLERAMLFNIVEVEVNSRCNRRCSYCPVSLNPTPPVPRLMKQAIFDRLVAELVRLRFAGKISYHFYNEPLIRRDLETLVECVRERLPDAYQLLYTNGDLLSDARYDRLIAAGIKHFMVTRHSGEPMSDRPAQTVRFPEELVLTNRGGKLANVEVVGSALKLPCYAPSDFLTVTVTGDIVLCCDDFDRRYVMGNIMTTPVDEIWESVEFARIRSELAAGNREGATSMCAQCSSREFFGPGENYEKDLGG